MIIRKNEKQEIELKTKDVTLVCNSAIRVGDINIDSSGEYEVGGIFITGIYTEKEETVFLINAEGLTICYLGPIKHSVEGDALEMINGVDILFLPAGAEGSLDTKSALKLLQKIDPKVVVPIYLTDTNEFLKEEGIANPRREKNLKITSKDLPVDDRELIILE